MTDDEGSTSERLEKALREFARKNRDLLDSGAGPIMGDEEPERFVRLAPHVRTMLAGLTKEETEELPTMIRDWRNAKFLGRVGMRLWWGMVFVAGSMFAAAKFGFDVLTWIKGGGR